MYCFWHFKKIFEECEFMDAANIILKNPDSEAIHSNGQLQQCLIDGVCFRINNKKMNAPPFCEPGKQFYRKQLVQSNQSENYKNQNTFFFLIQRVFYNEQNECGRLNLTLVGEVCRQSSIIAAKSINLPSIQSLDMFSNLGVILYVRDPRHSGRK